MLICIRIQFSIKAKIHQCCSSVGRIKVNDRLKIAKSVSDVLKYVVTERIPKPSLVDKTKWDTIRYDAAYKTCFIVELDVWNLDRRYPSQIICNKKLTDHRFSEEQKIILNNRLCPLPTLFSYIRDYMLSGQFCTFPT